MIEFELGTIIDLIYIPKPVKHILINFEQGLLELVYEHFFLIEYQ